MENRRFSQDPKQDTRALSLSSDSHSLSWVVVAGREGGWEALHILSLCLMRAFTLFNGDSDILAHHMALVVSE